MKSLIRPLAAALLACASLASHAADKVIFQLDWVPGGDKSAIYAAVKQGFFAAEGLDVTLQSGRGSSDAITKPVSYTHLRAPETVLDLVCRLLLEK